MELVVEVELLKVELCLSRRTSISSYNYYSRYRRIGRGTSNARCSLTRLSI